MYVEHPRTSDIASTPVGQEVHSAGLGLALKRDLDSTLPLQQIEIALAALSRWTVGLRAKESFQDAFIPGFVLRKGGDLPTCGRMVNGDNQNRQSRCWVRRSEGNNVCVV